MIDSYVSDIKTLLDRGKNVTCGGYIITKDSNGRQKILVGHPTGSNSDTYSLPKGLMDDGELPLDTFIRETFEETSLDISQYRDRIKFLNIQPYPNKQKYICSFVLEVYEKDLTMENLICTSLFTDRRTNTKLPEIDQFLWVDIENADKKLINEFYKKTNITIKNEYTRK